MLFKIISLNTVLYKNFVYEKYMYMIFKAWKYSELRYAADVG